MSQRVFYLIMFVLMALATHLAYILFVPNSQMSALLAEYGSANGVNKFTVQDEQSANKFLKHHPADVVSAVCLFDLSTGPVKVSSTVVGSYWSLSVYSSRGDVIYTLNDRQAASERVNVTIHRSGDTDQPVLPQASGTDAGEASVASEDWQGLVVIRGGVSLPHQSRFIAEVLAQSTCRA